ADYAAMGVALAGVSIPNFVLGPVLVLGLALTVYLLPPALWQGPESRVLPVLTLSTAYVAYIARLTRGGMLETLRQDYIRTARARGVPRPGRGRHARAAARHPPGGVLPRPRHGAHHHGLDRGREHLRGARSRSLPGQRRLQPRLHAGAGRGPLLRHVPDGAQP